jgi:diguanylate cyclase (GGDEF)-like protein
VLPASISYHPTVTAQRLNLVGPSALRATPPQQRTAFGNGPFKLLPGPLTNINPQQLLETIQRNLQALAITNEAQAKLLQLLDDYPLVGMLTQLNQGQHAFTQQLSEQTSHLGLVTLKDHLTGLPGRKQFEFDLQQAVDNAKNKGTSVALVMLDGDNFKLINDRHGHDIGDSVLRHQGRVLRQAMGEGESAIGQAYRVGGEEFMLIIPNISDSEQVKQHLDTITNAFAHLPEQGRRQGDDPRLAQLFGRHSDTSQRNLSLSAGAVLYTGWHPLEESLTSEALTKHVDELLYKAKAEGRNRAVIAQLAASHEQAPEPVVHLGPEGLKMATPTLQATG